jgi:hypothetical protein
MVSNHGITFLQAQVDPKPITGIIAPAVEDEIRPNPRALVLWKANNQQLGKVSKLNARSLDVGLCRHNNLGIIEMRTRVSKRSCVRAVQVTAAIRPLRTRFDHASQSLAILRERPLILLKNQAYQIDCHPNANGSQEE